MTPAARLQATIEILDGLSESGKPADRFIRDWFRARRFAGSKDRAAITENVFGILRQRGFLAWRAGNDSPRALVLASLLTNGTEAAKIEALFCGGKYGPAEISDAERTMILRPAADPPLWAAHNFPEFLEPELTRAFGPDLPAQMAALNERASVDLRANTLKAEREAVLSELREAGYEANACRYSPLGIRLPSGRSTAGLQRTALYESGAFEFQDEAAQLAALLCEPAPGQSVLDCAAGAGGKSLALAALMKNRGRILACDVRGNALRELEERASRAGANIIRTRTIGGHAVKDQFDVVLVDAPCGGSGTWRRQPELKWRLTPGHLRELQELQARLIAEAANNVAPGGLLVYATCSILPSENEERVEEFLKRRPDFRIDSVADRWVRAVGTPPPKGLGKSLQATPLSMETDGFFVTRLARSAAVAGSHA